MRTRFGLLVRATIDESRHRHDVLLDGDRTASGVLRTDLHHERVGTVVVSCTFGSVSYTHLDVYKRQQLYTYLSSNAEPLSG